MLDEIYTLIGLVHQYTVPGSNKPKMAELMTRCSLKVFLALYKWERYRLLSVLRQIQANKEQEAKHEETE
ncbi:MAG: hypothetical protein Q8O55_08835 [Dehalococcoidales bacterium]|nr:hypothetical protein [Dehalococcoidales bacterium]